MGKRSREVERRVARGEYLHVPAAAAGRGNAAVFPSGGEAVGMVKGERARRLVDRVVDALVSGDGERIEALVPEGRRLSRLRASLPWTCRYAEERFAQHGLTAGQHFRAHGELLASADPQVKQRAVSEYFKHTLPRQAQPIKVDGRHVHAVIHAEPEDLVIAPRKLGEGK